MSPIIARAGEGRGRGMESDQVVRAAGLYRRRSVSSRPGPGPFIPRPGSGRPARRARKHAAATAVEALAGARLWSWNPAATEELTEAQRTKRPCFLVPEWWWTHGLPPSRGRSRSSAPT